MNSVWFKCTGVSGAVAVTLGAIGAHMIMKKDDAMKEEIRKPENQRDLMIRLLTDKVLKHLSAQVN